MQNSNLERKMQKYEVKFFPILNIREKIKKIAKIRKIMSEKKIITFFTDTYEASFYIKVRGPQGLDLI